MPDLALALELLEFGEQVVALDCLHAGVVELVEVEVVRSQPSQAGLQRAASMLGRPVLWALGLVVAGALAIDHIPELGRDLDARPGRAGPGQGGAHDLLVEALAVGVRGVEEGDAEVEGAGDQGIGILVLAPPIRPQGPGSEADRRALQVSVSEAARAHAGESLGEAPGRTRSKPNAGARTWFAP